MGFDPIMMAMINRLTKGGGAGYVSTEVVEIIPEIQVQFNAGDGVVGGTLAKVVIGKTYNVLWDGQSYSCVCKESPLPDFPCNYLGNFAPIGGEDTGEPFFVIVADAGSYTELNIVSVADENDHTCSIMGEAETIHTIEPKFIPGAVLPVVELSTTFAEGASYTAEENAKLKAAWESETPVVIKCPVTIPNASYDATSFVWNRVFDSSTPYMLVYAYFYGPKLLMIYSADNGETWGCMTDVVG